MRIIALLLAALSCAAVAAAQIPQEALQRKEAGNQFLRQRRYAEARDQYLEAVRLAPEYADAHYNLGVIYFFRLQDYPRALVHLVEYARLRPDAEDMHQVRSLSLQALERVEAADREAYQRAVADGTAAALEAYLAEHPGSAQADAARRRLESEPPR